MMRLPFDGVVLSCQLKSEGVFLYTFCICVLLSFLHRGGKMRELNPTLYLQSSSVSLSSLFILRSQIMFQLNCCMHGECV